MLICKNNRVGETIRLSPSVKILIKNTRTIDYNIFIYSFKLYMLESHRGQKLIFHIFIFKIIINNFNMKF